MRESVVDGTSESIVGLTNAVNRVRAVDEFMAHYHQERNHQGLGNRLIRTTAVAAGNDGAIDRGARLGGMLNFYYRQAA